MLVLPRRPLLDRWLLAIPVLVGLYLWAARRRRRAAATFANPALVPNLVPRSPGWRRHIPTALVLVSLAVLVVGIARPHVVRDVTRNEATIGGLDAQDFPPAPVVKDGVSVTLKPKELRQAIAQTVFAAATDDSRPVLTGVDVAIEGDQLTFAAADGFRLSVRHLQIPKPVAERVEVIVPRTALAELNRLLPEETEPVQMTLNATRTQALFRLKNVELVAQLIQGTFPNYQQLIPDAHTSRAVIDVNDFLRETRRPPVAKSPKPPETVFSTCSVLRYRSVSRQESAGEPPKAWSVRRYSKFNNAVKSSPMRRSAPSSP